MHHLHDSGYKRLFSNLTIFRQLVESFVEEEWVAQLDFDRAERIDKSFVAEHYKESESDLIYRIPLRDSEQSVILYLLIEFQSTVDRFMALRVLYYIVSFYMDYRLGHGAAAKTLPAIFPIVLYNGDAHWTAPVDVADLIERVPDLRQYALRYEYFKVAENEYSREALLAIRNIVATLFLAEAHYDIHLLYEPIIRLFEEQPDRQAVQAFLNWFRQLTIRGYRPAVDYQAVEQEVRTIEEVKHMLMTAIERDREALLSQGLEQGIKQGIKQGVLVGKREIVQTMARKGLHVGLIAEMLDMTETEVQQFLQGGDQN
jgi:predicted transposase/invertase (TIGR01784 family)